MPETRQHRGPHPNDGRLFNDATQPVLARAVGELSWLLSRGYTDKSSLKLVGDRHSLMKRQRDAVMRSACGDQALTGRLARECQPEDLAGQELAIDGFNVLTTIEAAIAGGVLLHGRDGCVRDLASMHGNYRKVRETIPAVQRIGQVLTELRVAHATWLLDQPVSNSGRLKTILCEIARERNWPWRVELVPSPDRLLIHSRAIVASADAGILDRCEKWFALTREVLEGLQLHSTLLDLSRFIH